MKKLPREEQKKIRNKPRKVGKDRKAASQHIWTAKKAIKVVRESENSNLVDVFGAEKILIKHTNTHRLKRVRINCRIFFLSSVLSFHRFCEGEREKSAALSSFGQASKYLIASFGLFSTHTRQSIDLSVSCALKQEN